MSRIAQDVRYAFRRLRAAPLFSMVAILTLALGLGVNTAVLGVAHTIFLKPLAVPDASRVMLVDATIATRPPNAAFALSYPDYLYFRDHARSFETLAAHYGTSPMHVVSPGGAVGVTGSVATANYFTALRLQPAAGRFFTEEEDRVPGRDAVAVLSERLWQSHFSGDPSVVGTSVRINGTPFTIIGIAPTRFLGVLGPEDRVDLWIPTAMFDVGYRYCNGFARDCHIVSMLGRLADGVTIGGAQTELTLLAQQLEAMFPDTNKGRGVIVRPARGVRVNEQTESKPLLSLIAAAAALVWLVSCANVASLLLARGLQRRRELAVQLALGASPARILQQLLVESAILSIAGAIAGVFAAMWSSDLVRAFLGVDLSLDLPIVVAAFVLAVVTGVATGLAPALHALRGRPLPALKDEAPGLALRPTRVRETLIAVQVAVSVVLLAARGLVVRSFLNVHKGPGFDPDRLIIVRLRPSLVGYSAERSWAFQREVIRRLEQTAGVVAASPANVPPLPGWVMGSAELQPADGQLQPVQIATTTVGPSYFRTLGVTLVEGREFDDRDSASAPRRAIVNETLARHVGRNAGTAGSLVRIDGAPVEIVGVVKDVQYRNVLAAAQPIAYFNYWQQNTGAAWSHDSRTHVRVAGDASASLPTILRVVASVEPDVPISEAMPLAERLDDEFSALRTARAMFLTFGALTLVLSVVGLYATLAFAVGQRRREIAIRMALGANRLDVGTLVLRRGAFVVSVGVVMGIAVALTTGTFLAHMLYGVSPRDPLTLVAGPSILAAVALFAIWLTARRAMALDPAVALRGE